MTIQVCVKMETCHNMTTYNKTSTTENWVRSFFRPFQRTGRERFLCTIPPLPYALCSGREADRAETSGFSEGQGAESIGFSEESYVIPIPPAFHGRDRTDGETDGYDAGGTYAAESRKHPDDYGQPEGRQVYPKDLDCALAFQTRQVYRLHQGLGIRVSVLENAR